MKDLFILLGHLLTTIAKLLRPGGVRTVAAENALLKQQLLVVARSRRRAPNFSALDRFLFGKGVPAAVGHPAFAGVDPEEIEALLASARRLEAATRHKANPSIPTLGRRAELLAAGTLTNDLPA